MPLPKAIPRPKLKDFLDSRDRVVSANEAEDNAGSDGDEDDDTGSECSASDDDNE